MVKIHNVWLGEDKSEELWRYSVIADYYKENPSRVEPNEEYLRDISDKLTDVLEKKFPNELEGLALQLLDFFGRKSNYI